MLRLRIVLLGSLYCSFGCISTCYGEPEDSEPVHYDDEDQDGWDESEDCDDQDASRNPGEDEVCDGEDNDCDGQVDNDPVDREVTHADDDGDGYGDPDATTESCEAPETYVSNGDDCDDHNANAAPGLDEVCDGVDNDCDGTEDEEPVDPPLWYADADGDLFGDEAVSVGACTQPEGYVANADDCDDLAASVHPGALEVCNNAADDDCRAETVDVCSYESLDTGSAAGTLTGRTENEEAGAQVSGSGDVDGDGYGDVLVGACGVGAGTEGAYWVRGPIRGTLGLALADAHLEGSAAADAAGAAVAPAGDVNDDGYDDVLFGAPSETDGVTTSGAAWLRLGPDMAGCEPYCDGAVVWGAADDERVGASVVGPGDVDGDGYDDIFVGAPGREGGGGAYLLTGTPSGSVSVSDADAVLTGEGTGQAGGVVAGPGDIDGDGYDDLAVLDTVTGVVWVVTGRPTGEVPLSGAAARLSPPLVDGLAVGSMAFGDFDGDDRVDVIVGSNFDTGVSVDVVAWGAFGPLLGAIDLSAPQIQFSTAGAIANAGVQVSTGADLDFDGTSDLLFAAPASSTLFAPDHSILLDVPGSVFVMHGPFGAGTVALQDASTRIGGGFDLVTASFADDLDRDGYADVLVGAPRDDTESTNSGAVFVFSGAGL